MHDYVDRHGWTTALKAKEVGAYVQRTSGRGSSMRLAVATSTVVVVWRLDTLDTLDGRLDHPRFENERADWTELF
jgi:hypothetical protein